ncbi:DUF305 domain-containing protein [Nibribacter koreensis]|uniref:DUF305 domain-containing protein n=1 Tax=Nibribacter koreensis TaxID=1084519 RepID=A0ABP8F5N0_9BACT
MKKRNYKYAAVLFLSGASCLFSACGQNSDKTSTTSQEEQTMADHNMGDGGASSNKMMDLMHENMTDMQKVQMTGDPDHDFALLMAVHHEGALTMAQEQVDAGKDTALVNIAKATLLMQKEEIDRLQKFADAQKNSTGDTAKTMRMMAPMKDMMTQMNHNTKGGTDHHFATLMSLHHQSGIDMAKAYIPMAKSVEIKAMAQKIINDQQKEKQLLDNWLKQNNL